jgi:hypothetical protein
MRSLARFAAATLLAALVGATVACGAAPAEGTLVAHAPDGMRMAIATAGARNVRVLHVDGGSIVRLREVFVPGDSAIATIAWSADGRELVIGTRGSAYAVDTRTWHVEPATTQATRATGAAPRG